MTKAFNAWAIYHPSQGLLIHTIAMSKFDAWAQLRLAKHPDEPMKGDGEYHVLGFRVIQVRVKYDEPEEEKS